MNEPATESAAAPRQLTRDEIAAALDRLSADVITSGRMMQPTDACAALINMVFQAQTADPAGLAEYLEAAANLAVASILFQKQAMLANQQPLRNRKIVEEVEDRAGASDAPRIVVPGLMVPK